MNHFPEQNRKFQSFYSRIRNAENNEEITSILKDLDPKKIEDTLEVLAKKQGKEIELETLLSWDYLEEPKDSEQYIYSDDNFTVISNSAGVKFDREGFGTVFEVRYGNVKEMKVLPLWRSMNFIEELIENGELRV